MTQALSFYVITGILVYKEKLMLPLTTAPIIIVTLFGLFAIDLNTTLSLYYHWVINILSVVFLFCMFGVKKIIEGKNEKQKKEVK